MSRDLIFVDEGSNKTAELAAATRLLSRLITYRRRVQPSKGRIAEELGAYEASSLEHSGEVAGPDPFAVE
jgi:hypothetical protein